jgi:hypothetical protein
MEDDHCQIVRDEFAKICRTDSQALLDFFMKFKYFTTNDLSQILNISIWTLRDYKRLAKLNTGTPRKIAAPLRVPLGDLPDGWDCATWWQANYPKYGMVVLARWTGLNQATVRKRILRHGLRIRSLKESITPNHPCCNRQWLVDHYEKQSWSVARCAKAAGVSPDTIVGWLNRHRVQIRSRYGPVVGKTLRLSNRRIGDRDPFADARKQS